MINVGRGVLSLPGREEGRRRCELLALKCRTTAGRRNGRAFFAHAGLRSAFSPTLGVLWIPSTESTDAPSRERAAAEVKRQMASWQQSDSPRSCASVST